MGWTLRDYQQECLQAIFARYTQGVRRQLVCLPTGTGKTVIFSAFPSFFRMRNRMLVLAHREELLEQARDKILRANPELSVEIEMAERTASDTCDVVVASVPTLGRRGSERLRRLSPERFYLIVVDEAHHSTASTYRRTLDQLGVFAPHTRKLLVGFTATPKRGDGQGLDAVFEEIVFSRSLPEMIEAGYLSPVAGYRVETDVDLSGVRTRMGDFVVRQLAETVNVSARNQLVVKVYKERLQDRPTLCFCVDVAHSRNLARAFRAEGIAAGFITGETAAQDRRRILAEFREGELRVLTNCMVLTEGFDEPSISGIILARPTRSNLLYTQMIGRGTRLHEGKQDVTVIDIVDVTRDQKISTLAGLFGLDSRFDLEGRSAAAAQEAIRWVNENCPWVRVDEARSFSDLRYRCVNVDLWGLETPDEIKEFSPFAWTGVGPHAYRLSLGGGEILVASQTILGKWEVDLIANRRPTRIKTASGLFEAIQAGDGFVRTRRHDSLGLVSRLQPWRRAPASKKQLDFLRRSGLKLPRRMNKGQASHLISMLTSRRG